MNKKIVVSVISFVLCVVLFFVEMIYLMLFSVRNGITREDVINIIDDISITQILDAYDIYNDLMLYDNDLVSEIIYSDEMNDYIKGNIKVTYSNIFCGKNNAYISSNDLLDLVNNKVESIDLNDYNSSDLLVMIHKFVDEFDSDLQVVQQSDSFLLIVNDFFSSKTTNFLLGMIIVILLIIILINISYDSFIWIGLPTMMSGILFLILTLSLGGTINTIDVDINVFYYVNTFLGNLISKMKFISVLFTVIGSCFSILYFGIKKGYVGVNDGKN